MRKYNLYIWIFLFVLTACQRDEYATEVGEGTLRLTVGMKNDLKIVTTRSLTTEEEDNLKKDCKVRIFDGNKLVRKYQGINNIPTDIVLASSENYRIRVTSGDSVAASFEKKFYEGIKPFAITKRSEVKVDVICNIGNTVTSVAFGESINTYFEDCSVKVEVKAENGALDFPANNGGKLGYFSLPAECDTLFCTFTAINKITGEHCEHIDTIPDVNSATLYNLTYEFKDLDIELPDTGGGIFDLKVDATPLDEIKVEEVIHRRPAMKAIMSGQPLALTQPTYMETGAGDAVTVMITGSTVLSQVEISSEQFPEYLGLSQQSFDLKNLTPEQESDLANGGITIDRKETNLGHAMNIELSTSLIQKYTARDGTRSIHFSATDQNGYNRTVDWEIIASNMSVQTVDIPNDKRYLIWATKATLFGSVLPGRTPQAELSFRYRIVGTEGWKTVPAILDGSIITAEVTGLEVDKEKLCSEYEYQLMEGEVASNVTCRFTTEKTVQLENSSFEAWAGSAPAYIAPSSNENDIFWDSGNHGSATLGKDVTTPDSNVKHSGNRSAKLTSTLIDAFVVKQFAAGNIFYGRYLDTEMKGWEGNGILGWGRPFSSRPIALTGWIRYNSGKVDNPKSGYIESNEQDQGYIFIALGDWENETYYSDSNKKTYTWTQVIATKPVKLFDHSKENKGTIAHGEQTWTESTDEDVNGTTMYPFTIRLDYWDEERIPTSIIVVASASKFGDYFAGSTKSTMWLDDLKLVYDENEIKE